MATLEERYLDGQVDFETATSEALGVPVRRADLVALLRALHHRPAITAQISDHDADLYDQAGFAEDPATVVVAATERDTRMRALTETALTVEQAANRLGVSGSRIRQRTSQGSLWAVKVGNKLLLPAEQFTATGLVPNIDRILTALPAGLHPLSIRGLLVEPRADLAVDGTSVSIVQWLTGGGDPATALEVIATVEWSAL